MDHEAVALPDRIRRLDDLAHDLSWSWHRTAREVFRRLDLQLWRATGHNPVQMLQMLTPEQFQRAAADSSFLSMYDEAIAALDRARGAGKTWWANQFPDLSGGLIAYFSAEFALHQSLPIYAGGLGVLAGDHCKEASDLGLPFVAVGFLYQLGYFHQKISPEGWQIERHQRLDYRDVALERALEPNGRPCQVAVPLGHGSVQVAVWQVLLGRVKLFLLDTDLPDNAGWERELSSRLYVSEREARLRQEVILGVGGVRALRTLGYNPTVWHLNEGHTAFVILERIRELVAEGESFLAALGEVRSTTVFTTHTPVPAGHDVFPFHMVDSQLARFWETAGERRNTFLALGSHDREESSFNMTAVALRGSSAINAVSRRHRQVTVGMWASFWGDMPEEQRPVRAITNGIHVPTWIAQPMAELFGRWLGTDWQEHQDEPGFWERIAFIPDEDLWSVRQLLRRYLLEFARERARQAWRDGQMGYAQVLAAGTLLDPTALTIGFARRFTEYKRPDLIFRNPARLQRILNAPGRPVQVIFAGKAHPADETGKRPMQRIYREAMDPNFGGRVAFVEDYDLHVAHCFVQGCDVWMNTPREPMEASGTSGMKAAVNGVPHLSVADGWWPEAYNGANGWMIDGTAAGSDEAEAEALYRLLEEQIVPVFYERDRWGLPRRWLEIVKASIRTVAPHFCARRMVKEYAGQAYAPMAGRALSQSVK
ncbi:MAG TPA: alpha-glucan family phosphorylase [Bryobacteraceae bacterium]|jgi:starch phosphorylase|nr:alpha-glucan family phosphorylase [Bryobacteraceae bacterium]